jgi:hypothetical protein
LTGYDQQHLVTYLRLLDADAEGADWREVAKIVLHIDPEREPDRTPPNLPKRKPSRSHRLLSAKSSSNSSGGSVWTS